MPGKTKAQDGYRHSSGRGWAYDSRLSRAGFKNPPLTKNGLQYSIQVWAHRLCESSCRLAYADKPRGPRGGKGRVTTLTVRVHMQDIMSEGASRNPLERIGLS